MRGEEKGEKQRKIIQERRITEEGGKEGKTEGEMRWMERGEEGTKGGKEKIEHIIRIMCVCYF